MTLFPTVGHFASRPVPVQGITNEPAAAAPGETRHGPRWLTEKLTEFARAAVRTKGTYLAVHFAQLRGRRGVGLDALARLLLTA